MLMSIDLTREEWETVIAVLEEYGDHHEWTEAISLAHEIQEQKDNYRG